MLISKPDKKDISALMKLWQQQYAFHNGLDPVYYVPNSENQDSVFEKYLYEAIEKDTPNILIAKDNDAIAGFITFAIEEHNYIDTHIKQFGEIMEIFVKKEYRKKGIGTKLVKEAERFFVNKGIKYVKISSSSLNDNATKFYKENGYIDRQILYFRRLTE